MWLWAQGKHISSWGQFYYGVFVTMKYPPSIFYICIFFLLYDWGSIFRFLCQLLSQYKLDQVSASIADITYSVPKLITDCYSCHYSSKLIKAIETVEIQKSCQSFQQSLKTKNICLIFLFCHLPLPLPSVKSYEVLLKTENIKCRPFLPLTSG